MVEHASACQTVLELRLLKLVKCCCTMWVVMSCTHVRGLALPSVAHGIQRTNCSTDGQEHLHLLLVVMCYIKAPPRKVHAMSETVSVSCHDGNCEGCWDCAQTSCPQFIFCTCSLVELSSASS